MPEHSALLGGRHNNSAYKRCTNYKWLSEVISSLIFIPAVGWPPGDAGKGAAYSCGSSGLRRNCASMRGLLMPANSRSANCRSKASPSSRCISSLNNTVPEHKQCPPDFLLVSERAEKFAFTLLGTSLTFWNRRMRTRMYGGVRRRGLTAPSYSISLWSFFDWLDIRIV